jgi:hypothetical protein
MRVTHHPKPAAPKVLARSVRGCSSLSSHPGDGAGGNHGRMLAIRTVLSDRGAPRWTMAQASTPTFDRSFTTKERPPACFEVL